jgi:hypothetical protein
MENTSSTICFNCSKSLPEKAKFCNACLTQIRCKECSTPLEKDAIGCFECGSSIASKNGNGQSSSINFNTISFRETLTERNIEAKFSDNVGKDLTGILRDAMLAKRTVIPIPGNLLQDKNAEEDTVYQEVHVPKPENAQPANKQTDEKKSESNTEFQPEHLTLFTVSMRALPASESEWVVLYGYYASNFGKDTFTRQDIIAKYDESKRRTPERLNALSSNFRTSVRTGRINALSDSFCMLEPGITLAKEILSRTKATVIQSKGKRGNEATTSENESASNGRKKIGKANTRSKRLNDIDFHPDGKADLSTFVKKYSAKSDLERILLFVVYMKDVLEIENVTYDHVYTCFEELDLNTPPDVPQTTRNCASKAGYIDVSNSKSIIVTTNGKNKIRNWTKNA